MPDGMYSGVRLIMNLYELLPQFIRLQDTATAGSSSEGILQRVIACFEDESQVTADQIADLVLQLRPAECDAALLYYISVGLGFALADAHSQRIDFSRWFVANLSAFYKVKGTPPSWLKQWAYAIDRDALRLEELYKHDLYEKGQYANQAEISTYYYLLNSARVDLLQQGSYLSIASAQTAMPAIDWVRPIHVLLRLRYAEMLEADTLSEANETVETTAGLSLTDSLSIGDDTFSLVISCVTTCEASCQPAEEVACTTQCEIACEVTSEVEAPPNVGPAGPQGPAGPAGVGDPACEDTIVADSPTIEGIPCIGVVVADPTQWEIGENVGVSVEDLYSGNGEVSYVFYDSINHRYVAWTTVPWPLGTVTIEEGDAAVICHGAIGTRGKDACEILTVTAVVAASPQRIEFEVDNNLNWVAGESVCVRIASSGFYSKGTVLDVQYVSDTYTLRVNLPADRTDALSVVNTDDEALVCHGECLDEGYPACEELDVLFDGSGDDGATFWVPLSAYPRWQVDAPVCISQKDGDDAWHSHTGTITSITVDGTEFAVAVTLDVALDYTPASRSVGTVCHGPCTAGGGAEMQLDFTGDDPYTTYPDISQSGHPELLDSSKVTAGSFVYPYRIDKSVVPNLIKMTIMCVPI